MTEYKLVVVGGEYPILTYYLHHGSNYVHSMFGIYNSIHKIYICTYLLNLRWEQYQAWGVQPPEEREPKEPKKPSKFDELM